MSEENRQTKIVLADEIRSLNGLGNLRPTTSTGNQSSGSTAGQGNGTSGGGKESGK
jgi:hypothetical protein